MELSILFTQFLFAFSQEAEIEEELAIQDDDDSGDENENQTSSAVQQTADQGDEDEEDSLFPDTSIDLQLTKEGKYVLNLDSLVVCKTFDFLLLPSLNVITTGFKITQKVEMMISV